MINSKLLLVIITFIDDFGLPDYRGFFVVVVIVFFLQHSILFSNVEEFWNLRNESG